MRIGVVSPFRVHDLVDLLDTPAREKLQEFGGVSATPVAPLVRMWHKGDHQICLFCLEPTASRRYILRGERLSIHVLPKRRSRFALPDGYRQECRLIREAVLEEKPEVLSAQWTYDHAWAALGCGLPTVVTCHDTPFRYAWIDKHWYRAYQLVLAWRVIRKARHLVCVSPYTATHIRRYFRPHAPIEVVPNGVPAVMFAHGRRRLQKQPAGNGRSFTFCTVAGWGPTKNIPVLLKAFALVQTRLPASRLVLFGRGLGPGQEAEQWAAPRGLVRGVEFAGSRPREKILEFLEAQADLMVHPALVETHGMSLVEAMACGVPVVAGRDSGAVPWTLEEGQAGYLCDVRKPRALAERMLEAMLQPAQSRALAEHAWASAKQRFTVEAAAAANERILQALIKSPP